MADVSARADHPDTLDAPVDTVPGAHRRFDAHTVGRGAATAPRWLRSGIAAALGAVAGTTLFATEAQGRSERRDQGLRERRSGRR